MSRLAMASRPQLYRPTPRCHLDFTFIHIHPNPIPSHHIRVHAIRRLQASVAPTHAEIKRFFDSFFRRSCLTLGSHYGSRSRRGP